MKCLELILGVELAFGSSLCRDFYEVQGDIDASEGGHHKAEKLCHCPNISGPVNIKTSSITFGFNGMPL